MKKLISIVIPTYNEEANIIELSKQVEFHINNYNHINNYIFIAPTGELEEAFFIYKYTQDNAKLYGGEIGWHLHPHPIDWLHLNSSFESCFLFIMPVDTFSSIISAPIGFNIPSVMIAPFGSNSVYDFKPLYFGYPFVFDTDIILRKSDCFKSYDGHKLFVSFDAIKEIEAVQKNDKENSKKRT